MLKKNANLNSGVYKIINTVNNKIYIGSAVNFTKRKIAHFSALRNKRHTNKKLQNSWNKYGEKAFIFKIFLYSSKEVCLDLEQFCIDNLKPYYNISKFANGGGGSHTESSKRKISKALKGLKRTEETKKRMSLARTGITTPLKGVPKSQEHKDKISFSNKGKVRVHVRKFDHSKVRELSENGLTSFEIAKELGVTSTQISDLRNRMGISQIQKGTPKFKLRNIDYNKIKNLYDLGKSNKEIAKITNTTSVYVWSVLETYGIKSKNLWQEVREEVINLYKQGIKIKDIAKMLNIPYHNLFYHTRKHKDELQSKI